MNIRLNKKEKTIRLQYIKAFTEKLYTLEKDFTPWLRYRKRQLRKILRKKLEHKQKRLRNGKLF